MKTALLDSLYEKYNIANLQFGIVHDKLGDVYEEFCISILSDKQILQTIKSASLENSLEVCIFKSVLQAYDITNFNDIESVSATNIVPHRETHGLSKTDIIITLKFVDGIVRKYAMSCKQSTVPKVAVAEFDVETICREVGITDTRLKELLLKHQTDASAKNLSPTDKKDLRERLAPIARRFVRWSITGCPDEKPLDLVYPTAIIKFSLKKPTNRYQFELDNGDFELKSYHVYTVEDYIDTIMYQNGKIRTGGFGTGLSWTYATGSKGVKIQFKA